MLYLAILILSLSGSLRAEDIEIIGHNAKPDMEDIYLCTTKRINEHQFVEGFVPKVNEGRIHHMLIFACQEPPQLEGLWSCGEMSNGNKKSRYASKPVCKGMQKIIYAWGMMASPLKLPEGVSFEIGTKSTRYVVVQLHYKDVEPFKKNPELVDNSGIILKAHTTPTPKRAGIYLLATGGYIPAHSMVFMDVACQYGGPVTLHPFAYRTHAHSHGILNSGYDIRDGKWTEIGRRSPQKKQIFAPATNKVEMKPGDIIAARCIMNNTAGNHVVRIGATQKDEMCNFYIMFWVHSNEVAHLKDIGCDSPGFPSASWDKMFDTSDEPAQANTIPGTETPIRQSIATPALDNSGDLEVGQDDEELVPGLMNEFDNDLMEDFY